MERWVQILIGTILSSVGLYVFYLIFEKFFKNCLKGSHAKEVTNGVDRIRLRVKQVAGTGTTSHEDREEMEDLVYEEYDTEEHEVLAVVLPEANGTNFEYAILHRHVSRQRLKGERNENPSASTITMTI